MQAEWNCHKHSQSPIVLVCTGNVWHFEGLCTSCVPEHTKNHPKNVKVQMEGIKEVLEKATEIKKKVSGICEDRLQQCLTLKGVKQQQMAYMKSLSQKRTLIIEEINIIFDKLIQDVKKNRAEQQKSQNESLNKLIASLEDSISFFKKEEYQNVEQFCRQIKKYYFKDNLEIYVQQFDEIIKEYREKVVDYNPFSWIKDSKAKVKLFIEDSFKLQNPLAKKEKVEKVDPVKKEVKKKQPQKKRCKNCGQDMQYLTQWKKHLVCRNCGGKERNYVKR